MYKYLAAESAAVLSVKYLAAEAAAARPRAPRALFLIDIQVFFN